MEQLNRKAIKEEARNFIDIDRKWLTMGLACLPITLITTAFSNGEQIAQHSAQNEGGFYFSVSFGGGFLTWLLLPFTIAMAGFFLNHLRGANPDWKSLYHEGIDRYGKYIVVGIVTDLIIALWCLLFIIPGIIKIYEYYFVKHIIHDNPELNHKQARDLSKRMTDNFKIDLFSLDLSFFPWAILEVLTFGLAGIYVTPYMNCAKAMYYENLKHNALVKGIARPEEFGIYPIPQENFDVNSPFVNDNNTVEYSEPVVEEEINTTEEIHTETDTKSNENE